MAKYRGLVDLSGKMGDRVYTDGKHGKNVRSAPILTEHQRKAKSKLPQMTTGHQNSALASELREVMKVYAAHFMPSNYYTEVLKKFGKVLTRGRILRLAALKGYDLHERMRFANHVARPEINLKVEGECFQLKAAINVQRHIPVDQDTFKLQFVLIVWDKNGVMRHDEVTTADMKFQRAEGKKTISTEFERMPEDEDYLLICACHTSLRGDYEGEYDSIKGMYYADMGSLTETGNTLLREHRGDYLFRKEKPRELYVSKKKVLEVRESK